jgi:hypothetical protein
LESVTVFLMLPDTLAQEPDVAAPAGPAVPTIANPPSIVVATTLAVITTAIL